MAFNLPTPQNLHTSNSNSNRGTVGSLATGFKSGGNLPISTNASQVINNTPSNATGSPAGVFFGMNSNTSTATYDATQEARVLLWSLQYNAPNRIQSSDLANGGSRFWLGSGATPSQNYKEFIIGGNDTPFCASQAGPVTMCIDISDNSNDNVIGSFDPTQVSAYAHGSVRRNLVGGSTLQSFFQRSFLFTTTKGSSNLPTFTGVSNFDDAIVVVQGDNYTNKIGSWLTKSGSSFFIPCPFSLGNGVNATNFNDEGVSVVSPASNLPNQENFRLTNDAMRIYLDTINGDSVVLSGSYSWGTAADWDFNISNSSTCELTGNFVGMGDFTVGSSITASGNFNLSNGFSVISIGANIDDIGVTGDVNIIGDSVVDFNGLTISDNLDFSTAGTYTLTECNVNNITNSSSGNVVINSVNSVLSTDNSGTGAGQVNIVSLAKITLNNVVLGSDIVIKDPTIISDGNDNNVIIRFSDVSSNTVVWDYTQAPPNINIEIYKEEYKLFKLKGILTGGIQNFNASQTIDNAYKL